MLKTLIFISFIINLLMFLYVLLGSLASRKDFNKLNDEFKKRTKKNIEETKSNPEKLGAIVGALVFVLALLAIAISPLIMLIIFWIRDGFLIGFRYFLIFSLFWPLFTAFLRTINKDKTTINEKHRLTIFMYLSLIFVSIMYTIFGFNFTLIEMIEFYSASGVTFSNTISILMPSLLIFSVAITFYSVISKISLLNIEDVHYPHWTMKYPFVLMFLVGSIYYVLIYMSELSIEQQQLINYSEMSGTISIVENFLAAAVIPLIIGIIFNITSEKRDKRSEG